MSCGTTTLAPCYCYDINYYMDAGTFTLVYVDCSGNTVTEQISGLGNETYYTLCSQCTPYTAFTINAQTGDYVRITPRNLLCVDSVPCSPTTSTSTPPPTSSGGVNTGPYVQLIQTCDPTSLCGRGTGTCGLNCSPLPPNLCNLPIQYSCCCKCSRLGQIPVYVQNNSAASPSNLPYINASTTILYSGYWLYGGTIYLGANQFCRESIDPCYNCIPCDCI
jgi:hypothetical protein